MNINVGDMKNSFFPSYLYFSEWEKPVSCLKKMRKEKEGRKGRDESVRIKKLLLSWQQRVQGFRAKGKHTHCPPIFFVTIVSICCIVFFFPQLSFFRNRCTC